MSEERIMKWFRLFGLMSMASGVYAAYLLHSHFALQISQVTGRFRLGLFVLISAYGLALVLCGLMHIILSKRAAEAEKSAQTGVRIASLYVFLAMGALIFLGLRNFALLTIILGAAINLVGLCPLCSKRRVSLFTTEDRNP